MKSSTLKIILVFGLGIFLGVGGSFTTQYVFTPINKGSIEQGVNQIAKLTNPYLECPSFNSNNTELNRIKNQIISFIEEKSDNDDSLKVSVYIRELNNGPWVGINENERYLSASLMKVPVMMMLLKQVEDGLLSLNDKLVYEPEKLDPNRDINNNALEAMALMVPGESYTIAELITLMVTYSSNEAFFTVLNVTNIDDRNSFEKAVGVNWNEPQYPVMVSVKNYSNFFRVLYNATYLNRETSEFALEILTKTRFDFGLKAGVPEGVLVANKYGNQEQYQVNDRVLESRNDLLLSRKTKFLHDCGIVYHPQTPYALCIMTRSAEKSNIALSEIIAHISEIVYRNQ